MVVTQGLSMLRTLRAFILLTKIYTMHHFADVGKTCTINLALCLEKTDTKQQSTPCIFLHRQVMIT